LRNDTGGKRLPYECGVEPATPTAHESYSIRFYLLTLVFIVFAVETFFLFPWAVVHDKLKLFGLRGLAARSPLAAGCILVLLLSLTGIPPTAGFMGKYFLFAAAVEKGMVLLASAARMITG